MLNSASEKKKNTLELSTVVVLIVLSLSLIVLFFVASQASIVKPQDQSPTIDISNTVDKDLAMKEAQEAYRQNKEREAEQKRIEQARIKLGPALRKNFAQKYENGLLDDGMDARVTTSGKGNVILNIQYIMVNKVWAYKLNKDEAFNRSLGEMGFKKVVLTDGYDENWNWTP
jgi:hypothetical protein